MPILRTLSTFLALPQLLGFGISASMHPQWELWGRGGFTPVPIGASWMTAGTIETGFKFVPWSGVFHTGSSLLYQRFTYQSSLSLGSFGGDVGSLPTTVLAHQICWSIQAGWTWQRPSGWRIGFDIGLSVPLWAGGSIAMTAPVNASQETKDLTSSLSNNSNGLLSYLGGIVQPRLTLIEVGYQF